jgi:hypothetical protein
MNFFLSNILLITLIFFVFLAGIVVFYDILKKTDEELKQEKIKEADSLTYYKID